MAVRDRDTIRATIAVVGTPPVLDKLWQAATALGAESEGEIILDNGDDNPTTLQIMLRRVAQPDPVIPHVSLIAGWLGVRGEHPTDALHLPDAVIGGVDLSGPFSRQGEQLLRVLEETLRIVAPPTGGESRLLPRLLVRIGPRSAEPGDCWDPDRASDDPDITAPFVQTLIASLIAELRERWRFDPPRIDALEPGHDLSNDVRRDALRLVEEAGSDNIEARVDARLRLMQLYQRAGHTELANSLLRAAVRERSETAWVARAPRTGLEQMLELRSWQIPAGAPTGVAILDGGGSVVCGVGSRIYRIDRTEAQLKPIAEPNERQWAMRPIDASRFLVVGEHIRVVDSEAHVQAETPTPRARAPQTSRRRLEPQQGMSLRVDPAPAINRLLVLSQDGIFLFELDTLKPVGRLERDDLVAAALDARGHVTTIHTRGTVGRWRPDSTIVERVFNLDGNIRDASISNGARRIAVLLGSGRTGGRLELRDGMGTLMGSCATEQANSIRLSGDGSRVFTLEHRFLRVRECDDLTLEHPRVRTLLEPPPWMPVFIDVSHDGGYVAMLARSYAGRIPLRLSIWG